MLVLLAGSNALGQPVKRQGGRQLDNQPVDLSDGHSSVLLLANAVADGGFEGGSPSAAWSEGSTNFGTPLCNAAGCGPVAGHSGDWWAWFGGVPAAEVGFVQQDVVIPVGSDVLSFWTWIVTCDSPNDYLQVVLDTTEVWRIDGGSVSCGELGYTQRIVGLGAFANGFSHSLLIRGEQFATNAGTSNFFVDDVGVDERALPVEMTSFTGRMTSDGIALSWTTASEDNNAGFEIEQAAGNSDFERVAYVSGHGTTTEQQTYGYQVSGLLPGKYSFRLKQIDFDGAFEYSRTIEAVVVVPDQIWLAPVYPNPFNPTAVVSFAVPTDQHVRVQVYDVSGRIVQTLFDGVASVNTPVQLRLDLSGLQSGVYLVRAEGLIGVATQTVTLLK